MYFTKFVKFSDILFLSLYLTKKEENVLGSMPKYILGAGGQLYYFQGFREHHQDNCREQRKIFSGSKGSPMWASLVARL